MNEGSEKRSRGQTNVRLDPEDIEAIEHLVQDGEYESLSAYVRQAVKEKLSPKLRKARTRKELLDLLKEPEVRAELGLP